MAKKKANRPKFGYGEFCVFTRAGKPVQCYRTQDAARRVVAGMNRNPRINTRFRLGKRAEIGSK